MPFPVACIAAATQRRKGQKAEIVNCTFNAAASLDVYPWNQSGEQRPTGSQWVEAIGDWAAAGGVATSSLVAYAHAVIDCTISNGTIDAVLTAVPKTFGIVVRQTDSDNFIAVIYDASPAQLKYRIFKREASVVTFLADGTAAAATTGTLRVCLDGNTITGYINGLVVVTATTSFNAAATRHGVYGNATASPSYDSFVMSRAINCGDNRPYAAAAENAASALTIPTYDGSGEVVHPSIVYAAAGWNGYKYWMAMTPYPASNNDYENPSIVASNDGETWVVPAGLTNPIDPFPGGSSFNADPDLLLGQDNKLYCYWQFTDDANDWKKTIYVSSSSDGVNWSPKQAIIANIPANGTASHSVLYNEETTLYEMYQRGSHDVEPYPLLKRTCATPDGAWSDATECVLFGTPAATDLWHLSVRRVAGEYIGFWTSCVAGETGTNGKLWVARSVDGISWQWDSNPCLESSVAGWDNKQIYRSTAIQLDALHWDCWYSAQSMINAWGVGRTTIAMLN